MPQKINSQNAGLFYDNLATHYPDIIGDLSKDDYMNNMSSYDNAKTFYNNLKSAYPDIIGDMQENEFLGNMFVQDSTTAGPKPGAGQNIQTIKDGISFDSNKAQMLGYTPEGDQVAQVTANDNKVYGVVRNESTGEWRYYNNEKYDKKKPKKTNNVQASIPPDITAPVDETASGAGYKPNMQSLSDGRKFDSSSPQNTMLEKTVDGRYRSIVKLEDNSYAEVVRQKDGAYSLWNEKDEAADKLAKQFDRSLQSDPSYQQLTDEEKAQLHEKANYEPGLVDKLLLFGGEYLGPASPLFWGYTDEIKKKQSEKDALVKDFEDKWAEQNRLEALKDSGTINEQQQARLDQLTEETSKGRLDYARKKGSYEQSLLNAADAIVNPEKYADEVALSKMSQEDKNLLSQKTSQEVIEATNLGYAIANKKSAYAIPKEYQTDLLHDVDATVKYTQEGLNQKSLQELNVRVGALNGQSNSLSLLADMYESDLTKTYGQKYEEYKQFASQGAAKIKQDYDNAVAKNNPKEAQRLGKQYNDMLDYFSDISSSEQVKMLNQIGDKMLSNQTRVKEILSQDNYKVAKNVVDKIKKLKDMEEVRSFEIDEQWNRGEKFTSLWNLSGLYTEATPHMVARSIAKIPKGLVDITAAIGGAIDEDGKADWINGTQQWINRSMNEWDAMNPVAENIMNGGIYQTLNSISDMIPQAVIAYFTGGVGTAVGMGAKTAQLAGGIMANMAMSVYDMAEANYKIMPSYLSEEEKRRYSNTLAIMQCAGVGAAGEMLGGALGLATGKAGFVDEYLENAMGFNQISSAEINSIIRREANLLATGNVKQFIKNVNEGLVRSYGSLAKAGVAGTKKALYKGGVEAVEENVTEPAAQWLLEQVYSFTGGKGDVTQQEVSASPMGNMPSTAQQILVPFAVGTILSGASSLTKSQNSIYHESLSLALENQSQFLSQFAKVEAKYREKYANNPEALSQFDAIKAKVIGDMDAIKAEYDARKESVPENLKGSLVNLLRQKRDLENKANGLSPTKTSALAAEAAGEAAPVVPTAPTAPAAATAPAVPAAPAAQATEVAATAIETAIPTAQTEAAPATTTTEIPTAPAATAETTVPPTAPAEAVTPPIAAEAAPPKEEAAPGKGKLQTAAEQYLNILAELHAVNKKIDQLSKPEAARGFAAVGKSLYNKVSSMMGIETDEKNKAYINEATNARDKAASGKLTIDDVSKTEFYNSLSDEQKEVVQSKVAGPNATQESQIEVSGAISRFNASAVNMRKTEEENGKMLVPQDVDHNSSLRTKTGKTQEVKDNDNIVYRNGREYGVATEDQVIALMNGEDVKIKTTKNYKSSKESGKFVVEKMTDKNGKQMYRVFEVGADGTAKVKYDEIGDKALINSGDKRMIADKKQKAYQEMADQRKQEIIAKNSTGEVDGKPIYNEAAVEAELRSDKEFQSLNKLAQANSPMATQINDLLELSRKTKEAEEKEVNAQIDKAIADKIADMKKNKEIETEGCN